MAQKSIGDYTPDGTFDISDLLLYQRGAIYGAKLPATLSDLDTGTNPGSLITTQIFRDWVAANQVIYGSEYESQINTIAQTTFAPLGAPVVYDILNLPTPAANATYLVETTYCWNHDSIATDFYAELNDSVGGLMTSQPHRQEPADSGGGDPSGSDQRQYTTLRAEFTTGGAPPALVTFSLAFATSTVANESTIFNNIFTYVRVK